MSFLERIRTCQTWDPAAYRRFVIDGQAFGYIPHDLATRLRDFAAVFEIGSDTVTLKAGLQSFEARSEAVAEVLQALVKSGDLRKWRDESYPLVRRWGDRPVMLFDRCAAAPFGIRSFGVHVNGITERDGVAHMWIGRRALDKASAPGKLDHIVAGGQPYGLSVRENLIKESAEEADIPRALAERARPVGLVSYLCEWADGLRDDVLFCYDLELPPDFEPSNTDGEVDGFSLWPVTEVAERVRDSEDFKFNVSLVIIDYLLRRGYLGPDEQDYMELAEGLRKTTPD